MESVGALLPFVLILLAFYFLIIRPARNRQRAQHQLVEQLTVGSQVMTTSGLYAQVVNIEDDQVLLEVAPGVTMRWAKQAVARIITPVEAEVEDAAPESDAATGPDGTEQRPQ